MKKFVFIFLASLISFSALAQDPEEKPELDVRKVVLDGKEFAAFTREDARDLLQMRLDFPKLELKLETTEVLLDSKRIQISKTEALVKNVLAQKKVLKDDNIRLQGKLDNANAWYRSPVLWVIVGAVLGTGATVGITYATK